MANTTIIQNTYTNLFFCLVAYTFLGIFMGSLGFFALLWLLEQNIPLTVATTLAGLNTITTIFFANWFGHYADTRANGRKRVIQFLLLSSIIVIALWAVIDNPYVISILFVLGSALTGTIVPLLDSITVQSMPIRDDRKINFTVLRTGMTIGYVIGTITFGHIIDIYGINVLPYIGIVFLIIIALATPTLNTDSIPYQQSKKGNVLLDVMSIPWFKHFLLINLIYGLGTAFYYGLVSVYFADLGFAKRDMGIILLFGNITETIVFLFGKKIIQRFRPLQLMAFCGIIAALRWYSLSEFTGFFEIGLITALHGITFALYHSSASYYIQRNVPASMSSSAQTAFQTSLVFLPFTLLFPLGGYLYAILQSNVFQISACISLLSVILCLWTLSRKDPVPETSHK